MILSIRKFDISKIKKYSNILIIGRHESEKKTLIKSLLNNNNINDKVETIKTIVSTLEESDLFYSKQFLNSATIYSNYSTKIIDDCLKTARSNINETNNNSSLLILDNCIQIIDIKNDPQIKKVIINGRHYKLSTIITMQFPMKLHPMLRANMDYIFIFKDNIKMNLQRNFELYAKPICKSYNIFSTLIDSLEESECLVLDVFAKSNAMEDQIFYLKPEDVVELPRSIIISKL